MRSKIAESCDDLSIACPVVSWTRDCLQLCLSGCWYKRRPRSDDDQGDQVRQGGHSPPFEAVSIPKVIWPAPDVDSHSHRVFWFIPARRMLTSTCQALDLVDHDAQEDVRFFVKHLLDLCKHSAYEFATLPKELGEERCCVNIDQFGLDIMPSHPDCQLLGQCPTKRTFPCARWTIQ